MKTPIIPETYDQWHQCIVVECGLELTTSFIEQRISALKDNKVHYTKQFIDKYGPQHHQRVLSWFVQAREILLQNNSANSQ